MMSNPDNPEVLRLCATSEASNFVKMESLLFNVICELGETLDNNLELVNEPIDAVHPDVRQLEGSDRLNGLRLVCA